MHINQFKRLSASLTVALFAVVLTGCDKSNTKQPTDSYDPMASTLEKMAQKGKQDKKQDGNTQAIIKTTK
ncbi:hypothetical protein [Pollutimonas bauzanensis]|uniref:Lipoprotein n=1 Tax=Pollutimonas bauzanensis TaxID=658167 RepID=A0A1M5XLZ4_9BURK|nr:hypothetical protein [Pollutimonas bauzanensis]SHI00850.1 hypothetical protein SAMN04488135_10712 [Pollutimonas bauzanensis]